jgi:hypothetical protein
MGYHVTNSVTETEPIINTEDETRPSRRKDHMNQPGLIHLPPGLRHGTTQTPIKDLGDKKQETEGIYETSIKRHDNRSPSNDLASGSVLMGKLCWRALALIKHKVGTDGSVSDHMAQALATWLWQWGITIYTETEL